MSTSIAGLFVCCTVGVVVKGIGLFGFEEGFLSVHSTAGLFDCCTVGLTVIVAVDVGAGLFDFEEGFLSLLSREGNFAERGKRSVDDDLTGVACPVKNPLLGMRGGRIQTRGPRAVGCASLNLSSTTP